jgi:hypothetical protein
MGSADSTERTSKVGACDSPPWKHSRDCCPFRLHYFNRKVVIAAMRPRLADSLPTQPFGFLECVPSLACY